MSFLAPNPEIDLSIYLVTDRQLIGRRSLAKVVEEAIAGGVTAIQLREKGCSTREFVHIARSLIPLLARLRVPLIINDRVDVAFAVGADGVHVGQSDMPCDEARRLLGPHAIIGLTVERVEQMETAACVGADYWGVGPVYPTPTKLDAAPPMGLEGLHTVCRRSPVPVIAVGGITPANVEPVMACGVRGVAVVSAICGQADPFTAAKQLKDTLVAVHVRERI